MELQNVILFFPMRKYHVANRTILQCRYEVLSDVTETNWICDGAN